MRALFSFAVKVFLTHKLKKYQENNLMYLMTL